MKWTTPFLLLWLCDCLLESDEIFFLQFDILVWWRTSVLDVLATVIELLKTSSLIGRLLQCDWSVVLMMVICYLTEWCWNSLCLQVQVDMSTYLPSVGWINERWHSWSFAVRGNYIWRVWIWPDKDLHQKPCYCMAVAVAIVTLLTKCSIDCFSSRCFVWNRLVMRRLTVLWGSCRPLGGHSVFDARWTNTSCCCSEIQRITFWREGITLTNWWHHSSSSRLTQTTEGKWLITSRYVMCWLAACLQEFQMAEQGS